MLRSVVLVLGLAASAALATGPVFALTKQQKLETCTFGADNQKLTGDARKTFLARCMADEDRSGAPAGSQQQKQ